MDFRIENSNSHVKDFQSEGYWIPATPAKPSSSPICSDREEKQSNLTIFGVSHESQQGVSFQNSSSACCVYTSKEEYLAANSQYLAANLQLNNGSNDDVSIYNNFSTDIGAKLNMPFQDLLALADAAGVAKTAPGVENGRSSSILPFPKVHVEGIQVGTDLVNLQRETRNISQGGFQIMGYSNPNTQQCGQHIPSRHVFDLNSAPGTISEVDFQMPIPSQFAPVTPDQTRRLESRQISDILSSIRDERTNQAKEKLNIEKNCTNLEVQPQLLQEQSCDTVSMQLQENLNSDNGAIEDANMDKTPQQKPRRKKHRPKVIIEGQPKRTSKPKTPKPDTPTVRRKYVRRKGVENPDATLAAEANETNDAKTVGQTRKSCRRSINFDAVSQMNEERFSCAHEETLRTGFQSTVQLKQGMDRTVEKTYAGIAYELTRSTNQMLENYLSLPDKQASSPVTPNKIDLPCTRSASNAQSAAYRKGKCRIHFSDETHDKETSITEIPNDSNCSTSAYMKNENQDRRRKRQNSGTIGEMEMCTFNSVGAQYNSCQAYLPFFLDYGTNLPAMHFPVIYKKKRTGKGQHLTTSSILSAGRTGQGNQRGMATGGFSLESGWGFSNAQFNAINVPGMSRVSGTQDEQQSFNCMLAFDQTIKYKKKRTKGLTRVRDLASFAGIQWPTPCGTASRVMQGIGASHQPRTGMEDLTADIRVKLATRKRTKRNSSGTSMPFNPFYHHQSGSYATGFPPRFIWKSMNPIDALIQQFEHLDINAQSSEVVNQEQHALIPYYTRYQEKNALVVYQRDGTLVPFEDSFNQIRRRKPRPKVDLDDETTRVWRLLLEDINSQGIDGTDEEKAKWWEEERRVFRGRADSFIARMHLVQGDRRFSRWKGSVVDSVVGVFLTQNVSDHLSSSAFMSLAARFPLKSERTDGLANEAETSISVKEPEIYEVDQGESETIRWHEGKSSQTANDQSSMTLHDADYREEKVVNSIEFSRSSTIINTSKDKVNCEALDMCGSNLTMYHESAENRSDAQVSEQAASFMGDRMEAFDVLSSQNSVVSSQNSVDSLMAQNSEIIASYSRSCSGAELAAGSEPVNDGSTFTEALQMQGTILHGVYDQERVVGSSNKIGQYKLKDKANSELQNNAISTSCRAISPNNYNLNLSDSGSPIIDCFDLLREENLISIIHQKYEEKCASEQSELSAESANQTIVQEISTTGSPGEAKSCNSLHAEATGACSQSIDQSSKDDINQHAQKDACGGQQVFDISNFLGETSDVTESTTMVDHPRKNEQKANYASLNDEGNLQIKADGMNESTFKAKRVRTGKAKQNEVEWDCLRQQARNKDGKTRGNTPNTMDSLDYEAVRCADVNKIADTIKERGMNNMLAERIKAFLNRLVSDHGSIDLEWLRDVPPDKAKEYLLSFRGLGLKSVECVRLLCLHHLAFPVDTNVGRIAVRLGWVPLQPLPESLQLHLLELYPVLESIQKFLWPRLCKLDQRTLYELHYQMITFGKVFCTKSKPNCNACPMRGECRHFASAFASARLSLPAPEEKSIVSATESKSSDERPTGISSEQQLHLPAPPLTPPLPPPPANHQTGQQFEAINYEPVIEVPATPGPLIEVPTTPEQEPISNQEKDIEDGFGEDPDEIPTIKLNIEEFTQNLQNYMETNMELQDGEMSRALVALTKEAASIPTPKLKNVSRLRTEHRVYELPDSHPLLKGLDKRERDDPCSYLLAIWTPGETADSIQPPGQCNSQELGRFCDAETCFSCNSVREANAQTVRGTLLIPCRTAMRGSFPLNGTYFQVNEVFADHDSSINPIAVPRSWLWNLPRRTVYFGTSIPTIFKGLTTEGIQYCFWRGFVCVRGFDQTTRAPRPLLARLHFPASRLPRTRGRMDES